MLADPRWAPLHDQLDSFDWDDFVAVPLVARDRVVGALNAYYRPGHAPDDDEIAFLTAMADQAAVAVENARLLAEVRGEAAPWTSATGSPASCTTPPASGCSR